MAKKVNAKEYGELNAVNLKNTLWDTLNEIKNNKIMASEGDAIASQAREILRTTKVQLKILQQASKNVTQELIDFAKPRR